MTVYNYCHTVFFLLSLSVPRLTREGNSSSFLTLAVYFPSFFHKGNTVIDPMSDGVAHIDKSDLPTTNSPWSHSHSMTHLTFPSMIHTSFSKHRTVLLSFLFVAITKYDLSKCFTYKIHNFWMTCVEAA